MQATLVHNPTAGTGSPTTEELVEILEEAGISATPYPAKDKNLAKILARASGLVIAAGGDGTIARVITQLKDRETRVAILPLGTANNIARSFGITGPVEEIIAGWQHGSEQQLDIGVAEGPFEQRRFLEAVGVGALADVTTKKIKEEGSLAKQVERGRDAIRQELRKAKPIKVKLTLDDRPIKEEVLLLEIMNIGFVGPNLRLATAGRCRRRPLRCRLRSGRQSRRDAGMARGAGARAPPVNVDTGPQHHPRQERRDAARRRQADARERKARC